MRWRPSRRRTKSPCDAVSVRAVLSGKPCGIAPIPQACLASAMDLPCAPLVGQGVIQKLDPPDLPPLVCAGAAFRADFRVRCPQPHATLPMIRRLALRGTAKDDKRKAGTDAAGGRHKDR
jgi:hypothetical protein